jgi:GTP pyrophosphokinase
MGAKVNGKLVPISHRLRSGDQIEIITSKKQKPKEDWLKYVVTGRAKSKIKQALKEHKKELAQEGKVMLDRKFGHLNIHLTEENYMTLAKFYKLTTPLDLFYQIAIQKINLHHFPKHEVKQGKLILVREQKVENENNNLTEILKIKGKTDDTLVIGEDMQEFDYTLAKCCNPIPGDEVFGFITINDGIKIHKTSCPNAVQLLSNYAYRVVKARWTSQEQIAFLAGIKVTGLDKVGIVNEITRIISNELNVNMRSISFDSNDGIFEGKIMVFVHDTFHLDNLMKKLRNVEGVIHVMRIENVKKKRL